MCCQCRYVWLFFFFFKVPMCEGNFFQLQNHFPHSQHTYVVGLSAVNIEALLRGYRVSPKIQHKMDAFNVIIEMIKKSFEEINMSMMWTVNINVKNATTESQICNTNVKYKTGRKILIFLFCSRHATI